MIKFNFDEIKKLAKAKIIVFFFSSGLAFVLGGFFWAYFSLLEIKEPLIIHSNDIVRINQVGDVQDLVKIVVVGLIVTVFNFFISLELEKRDWFLGKLLGAATMFFDILLFIAFAAIISAN